MPRLIVESDAPEAGPFAFPTDPRDLLALLSFGVAEPFQTQHPLTLLVRRLKRQHALPLEPLLTFYDRHVTDEVDQRNLDHAWQPAAPLRECVAGVRAALTDDAEARRLAADYPALTPLLAALEEMAAWAAARRARIRLSFEMD